MINYIISELTQIWTQDSLSPSLLVSFAPLLKGTQLAAKPKINGEMEAAGTAFSSNRRQREGTVMFHYKFKSTSFPGRGSRTSSNEFI